MSDSHSLMLLFACLIYLVAGSVNGNHCMVPVTELGKLFSSTDNETSVLANSTVKDVHNCTEECCNHELCSVVVFNQTSALDDVNCFMYACDPLYTCTIKPHNGTQVYIVKDLVNITTSNNTEISKSIIPNVTDIVLNTAVNAEATQFFTGNTMSDFVTSSVVELNSTTPVANSGNTHLIKSSSTILNSENYQDSSGSRVPALVSNDTFTKYASNSSYLTAQPTEILSTSIDNVSVLTTSTTQIFIGSETHATVLQPLQDISANNTLVLFETSSSNSSDANPISNNLIEHESLINESPANVLLDVTALLTEQNIDIVESAVTTTQTQAIMQEFSPTPTQFIIEATKINKDILPDIKELGSSLLSMDMPEEITIPPSKLPPVSSFILSSKSIQPLTSSSTLSGENMPKAQTEATPFKPLDELSAGPVSGEMMPLNLNNSALGISLTITESSMVLESSVFSGNVSQNLGMYNPEENIPTFMTGILIGSLSLGCVFVLLIVTILGKRIFDSYKEKEYSRLDYLINGMYS